MGRVQLLVPLALLGFLAIAGVDAQDCPNKFRQVGARCLHVSNAIFEDPTFRPVTWGVGRNLCKNMTDAKWTVDLLSNFDVNFLRLVSLNIHNNYPDLSKGYYIYWIGGEYLNDQWQWLDGTPIDPHSYIWLMNCPRINPTGSHTMLVPAGPGGKRQYANEYGPQNVGPSFICEAKSKK
ncbi:uncharacterized protein [Cherax quadricarinatus]